MRKIILGVASSLDGRIEGPKGEYDWCFTDQDYGMSEFMNSIDAIFYGRKSFELTQSTEGGEMFAGFKSYVFTNSGKTYPNAEVISGNILEKVKAIKSVGGKNIWLFGGAELTKALLELKLVDEMWLAIHPIVLGKGKLLFDDLDERTHLKLIDSKTYTTGLISAKYAIVDKW